METTQDSEKTVIVRVKKLANLLDRFMTDIKGEIEKKTDFRNISAIQGRIVLYLYSKSGDDVLQKDIARHFDIREPTAAIILRRMENNGLIARHTSRSDERAKAVTLTKKAVEMHPIAQAEVDEAENRITKGLSDRELELLNKVLDKIAGNIKNSGA